MNFVYVLNFQSEFAYQFVCLQQLDLYHVVLKIMCSPRVGSLAPMPFSKIHFTVSAGLAVNVTIQHFNLKDSNLGPLSCTVLS